MEASFSTRCLPGAGAPDADRNHWGPGDGPPPVSALSLPRTHRSVKCFLGWYNKALSALSPCAYFWQRFKGLRSVGQKREVAERCPHGQRGWRVLSRGVPSCMPGSGTSPWGCEEACSVSNSRCCSRSHSLPPNTHGPLATLRPAWSEAAGAEARVAQAARAGRVLSRSQSRNSLLKGKQRGCLAGVSGPAVPGSRLWGGTGGWNPGLRPLPQLMALWVVSAWHEDRRVLGTLRVQSNGGGEPRCPLLWGSRPSQICLGRSHLEVSGLYICPPTCSSAGQDGASYCPRK